MSFPTVAATNTSTQGSNSTTHVINLPASISSGDLLFAFLGSDGIASGTVTTPATGWTKVVDQAATIDTARLTVWYRIADGAEGASITVTTSASESSMSASYRINNWHGSQVPEATSFRSGGSNANPDPPSHTASWGSDDNLWIAVCAWDNTPTVTSFPTDYTDNQITRNGFSGGAGLLVATRNRAIATEDPGQFTISASEQWAAATIVVRPAAAGGGGLFQPVLSDGDTHGVIFGGQVIR